MNAKRKILITAISAVVVIVVVVAVLLALSTETKADYTGMIRQGNLYLENGEYDKALVAFQTALNLDETKEDAYKGLSDAYDALGYQTLSKEILERGYESTGRSETLRSLMIARFGVDPYTSKTEEVNYLQGEQYEFSLKPVIDQDFLSFISSASFGDYEAKYEISNPEIQGNMFSYTILNIHLKLLYNNGGNINVIDKNTQKPYREIKPDEIVFTNTAFLFDFEGVITPDDLKSLNGISRISESDNSLCFEACGCEITLYKDNDGNYSEKSENRITPLPVVEETTEETTEVLEGMAVISGTVTDAATGRGLEGVTIGTAPAYTDAYDLDETVTDQNGRYEIAVPEGDCYIRASKDGYIAEEDILSVQEADEIQKDFVMTEELEGNVIRIVLTWGAAPSDLDSYLIGESGGGQYVETNFHNKIVVDQNGNVVAELDVDDVDAYGPETTTLYDMEGSYNFRVEDFRREGYMANSGAQVNVYKGDSLVETINVAEDVFNAWNVISIEHGQISVINEATEPSGTAW